MQIGIIRIGGFYIIRVIRDEMNSLFKIRLALNLVILPTSGQFFRYLIFLILCFFCRCSLFFSHLYGSIYILKRLIPCRRFVHTALVLIELCIKKRLIRARQTSDSFHRLPFLFRLSFCRFFRPLRLDSCLFLR